MNNKINREIQSEEVKLVTNDGLEIMSLDEALSIAYDAGVDLVEVAKDGDISICKCMDYSKFLYQQKKKSKSQAKKETLKEIKLGCLIADHDLMTKVHHIERLVFQGHKVKVVILLKGYRGNDSLSVSLSIYNRILNLLNDKVSVIKDIQVEGRIATFTVKGK